MKDKRLDALLQTFSKKGLKVVVSEEVPEGEIWFVDTNNIVLNKIINIWEGDIRKCEREG